MKKIIFFCILPFIVSCQTIRLDTIARLPDAVNETSGLLAPNSNLFWTMNDSGGEPKLYAFDAVGVLQRTVVVRDATNIDWEELTSTPTHIYIGDFGNNAQTRRNLAVYKIAIPTSGNIADTVNAEKINFSYEDQTAFPPSADNRRFDAEAFLVNNDSIWIFTKDYESTPYAGKTHIYRFLNTSGTHIAKLVSVLNTDASSKYNGAITAAARTQNGKTVLMSYLKIYVFPSNSTEFWRTTPRVFDFGTAQLAQREAIAFPQNEPCKGYVTSEKVVQFGITLGGNLTRFDICSLLTKTDDLSGIKLKVFPTPSVSDVFFEFDNAETNIFRLKIMDLTGKIIFSEKIVPPQYQLPKDVFERSGIYLYQLFDEKTGKNTANGKIIWQE